MGNLDIDEQILNALGEKGYVKEDELFSYLASTFPKEKKDMLGNRLRRLNFEGKIKKFDLYDVRCNKITFVSLFQRWIEAWNELIAKGYRTRPPTL